MGGRAKCDNLKQLLGVLVNDVLTPAGDSTDAISTELPGSIAAHIFASAPGPYRAAGPHSAGTG